MAAWCVSQSRHVRGCVYCWESLSYNRFCYSLFTKFTLVSSIQTGRNYSRICLFLKWLCSCNEDFVTQLNNLFLWRTSRNFCLLHSHWLGRADANVAEGSNFMIFNVLVSFSSSFRSTCKSFNEACFNTCFVTAWCCSISRDNCSEESITRPLRPCGGAAMRGVYYYTPHHSSPWPTHMDLPSLEERRDTWSRLEHSWRSGQHGAGNYCIAAHTTWIMNSR